MRIANASFFACVEIAKIFGNMWATITKNF